MNIRSLQFSAPQTVGFEITDTNNILAGFVAEAITVRATAAIGDITGAVVSAPGGSGATWSGASFTPDLAGEYVLTAANGLATPPMKFILRVLPAEVLDSSPVSDPAPSGNPSTVSTSPLRSAPERRALVRRIVLGAYGPVSAAAFAALTAQIPMPPGLSIPRGA